MATNNINNGDEGGNVENHTRNEASQNKSKFLSSFIKSEITGDNKNIFLDELYSANNIDSDLKQKLEKHKETGTYDSINISEDISLNDLKKEVIKEYSVLKNQRQKIQKLFKKEYELKNSDEIKINDSIKSLNDKTLIGLINSDTDRTEFLDNIFGKNKLNKKDLLGFMKNIKLSKSSLQKIKEDDNEELLKSLDDKLKKGYEISINDLEILLYLSEKEKKEFLKIFLPNVTLEKALELDIISDDEVKDIKKKLIENTSQSNDIELSQVEFDNVLNNLKNNQIYVNIEDYLKTNNVDKILDNNLDIISKEYNKVLGKIKEQNSSEGKYNEESFYKVLENSGLLKEDKLLNQSNYFNPGNIVVLNRSYDSVSGNTRKKGFVFLEVAQLDFEKGKIFFYNRGLDKYDKNITSGLEEYDFDVFLNLLNNKNIKKTRDKAKIDSFDIISRNLLLERIKNHDYIEAISTSGTTELKDEYDRTKYKLQKLIKENDPKKLDEINSLKQDLEELQVHNLESIKKDLNSSLVDPEGEKYGFEKGTTFKTNDSTDKTKQDGFFTILEVDESNGLVKITSLIGEEEFDFSSFVENFKRRKTKRLAKASTAEELMSDLQTNSKEGDTWKEFEFKDGGIYKKETDNKIEYDYLVSKDTNELIQIHSIDGDKVQLSYGEIKEEKSKDEKNKKTTFSVGKQKYNVTVGFLNAFIKEKNLIPRSLDEEKDVKDDNIDEVDFRKGFWSGVFNRGYSVAEVLAGFKVGIEGIQNFLKEGNDEHAARFAQGAFGKFLPDEIKSDLISRVENASKERMDAYVQKLKDVDSGPASQMIIKWLKNKNAAQYKKEAGLLFMIEKYGVLYAKDLAPYKGRFFWYESLGGKVGDKLYNQIKQQAKDENVPFGEERLVYVLLVNQCKGKGTIKRRSRLHKEFKRFRAVGKKDEYETGLNDGSDERQIEARLKGGLGELEGGTYANAVGFLESVVNKGGNLTKMNMMPFVIHFSGMIHGFDKIQVLDLMKNFPAKGQVLMTMRFLSDNRDIEVLNNATMRIIERISEEKNDLTMKKRAVEVFDSLRNPNTSSKDEYEKQFKKFTSFYDDYGDMITNALYMVNNGKTDENSKFNKMILLEKDEDPIFSAYYDKLTGFSGGEADFKQDDYMADAFVGTGVTGVNVNAVSEQALGFGPGGELRFKKIHSCVWSEIVNEFKAIARREYDKNPTINEQKQLKIIKNMLRGILAGFLKNHGAGDQFLRVYNSPTGPFSELNKWGIGMSVFEENNINNEILFSGKDEKSEKLLDEFSKQLLIHEQTGKDFSSKVNIGMKSLNDLIGNVKTGVDDNLKEAA